MAWYHATFGIIPLFALANAGVTISSETALYQSISIGIIAGLVFGKPIGIIIFSWLAFHLKLAILPENVNWKQIFAVGCLAGIGFTMSLFIANLAFDDKYSIDAIKPAVLAASIIAGCLGAFFLYFFSSVQSKSNSSFHERL